MSELYFITEIMGESAKSDLVQNLITFFIAWLIVKKTIAEHLKKIEVSLDNLGRHVGDLKHSLTKIERNHAERLTKLETQVEKLNNEEGEEDE